MGCGGSKEEDVKSMPAGQVVGKSQGAQITREEARERAAAAAEARAKASGRKGGGKKTKQSGNVYGGSTGKPDLADARSWD